MELDRQAIERRDFPVGRRGYDPAAVDAHLRALADEFDELNRTALTGGTDVSVASSAGTHVQSILQAAETAAAEIERNALESARQVREDADRDAKRTREEAIDRARQHVSAVAQVTARLVEHVGSMDGEVGALVESLRAGAGRLVADLSAVEAGMSELYDAASGRAVSVAPEPPRQQFEPAPQQFEPPPPQPQQRAFESELDSALSGTPAPPLAASQPAPAPEAGGGDLDGARLIALNMALNGESRADTERYLAENFELPDRLKLIDEVYSAIEG
ncbi:MAG TPA: DivIVA domain-containing protein [Solirubrobacteraceae bacterium]|nr:DivIVA domain-containing protein [Solirubrobacteraceae bacterium]